MIIAARNLLLFFSMAGSLRLQTLPPLHGPGNVNEFRKKLRHGHLYFMFPFLLLLLLLPLNFVIRSISLATTSKSECGLLFWTNQQCAGSPAPRVVGDDCRLWRHG